jgi:protein TonB
MSRPYSWLPLALLAAACMTGDDVQNVQGMFGGGVRPDVMPVLRNAEPPFRYPVSLYAQRVQGNVTLRIFIDTAGRVHPESTTVAETSGHGALDTAAVNGSRELSFQPAMKRQKPMAVWVLYPVHFRHPDAPPLPGDSAPAVDTSQPPHR